MKIQIQQLLEPLLSKPVPSFSTPNAFDIRAAPIPWFGDLSTSSVATLGINPSYAEYFFKRKKKESKDEFVLLPEPKRRLSSWTDLNALPDQTAYGVQMGLMDSCNRYFKTGNHYRWFNPLNQLLNESLGIDYLSGSACHLDLSPWPTTKVWRNLEFSDRDNLVADGKIYLKSILDFKKFDCIFMNGRTVINAIQEYFDQPLTILMHDKTPSLRQSVEIYAGQILGVPCLAWSANLQEYRGKKEDLIAVLKPYVSHFKIAGR
jgi:hypothetical protein